MPDNPATPAALEFAEDLREVYANNVLYEGSAWDLKLLFGQLDQSEGKIRVGIHTAVTVPWPVVKLMVYWLRGQIEVHEKVNGKIKIPQAVLPPALPPLTDEMRKVDPNADFVYELFHKLRTEFLEENLEK